MFVLLDIYIGFRLFVLLESRSTDLSSMPAGRTVLSASLPGPAPPPRRAPRLDLPMVYPGFGIHNYKYLSNPKPGHTTGGSGLRAQRSGGDGRAGQNGTPTDRFAQERTAPLTLWRIKAKRCGRLFGSTNKRNLMETDGGTQRPFDNRFNRGTRSALCSWLLASVPAPNCLCKPFSCRACPGGGEQQKIYII